MNEHLYMPKDHMDKLYHSKNKAVAYIHNSRLDQILNLVPWKTKTLLEVGCGEGHLIERIPRDDLKIIGIDVTKDATKSA